MYHTITTVETGWVGLVGCYSKAGGCLVAAPVENALTGIITERALSGDLGPVPAAHRGNVNNQGFGNCFYYKMLNFVINDSVFAILGLDLLYFQGSIQTPYVEQL